MKRFAKNALFIALCSFWIVSAVLFVADSDFRDFSFSKIGLYDNFPEIPPKPEGNSVRVCTWNVRNYAVFYNGGKVRPKPLAERKSLCKTIAKINPDVLLIQEIGEDEFLLEFAKLLAEEGQVFKWRISPDSKMSSRLGILSKIPVDKVFDFSGLNFFINGESKTSPRSTIGAKFTTNGKEWFAFTLHLKSKFGAKKRDKEYFPYRREEIGAILKSVSEVAGDMVCVGGDFNEEPRKEIENLFRDKGLVLLNSDSSHSYYWSKKELYQLYDYFYVSKGMLKAVDGKRARVFVGSPMEASDHNPVFIDINFSRAREDFVN